METAASDLRSEKASNGKNKEETFYQIWCRYTDRNFCLKAPTEENYKLYNEIIIQSTYDFHKVPGINTESHGENLLIVDFKNAKRWIVYDPLTKEFIDVPDYFFSNTNTQKTNEVVEKLKFYFQHECIEKAVDKLLCEKIPGSFFISSLDLVNFPYQINIFHNDDKVWIASIFYDERLGYSLNQRLFPTIAELIQFFQDPNNPTEITLTIPIPNIKSENLRIRRLRK